MIVTIQPSELKGTITAPASKSSMQRACAAALIRSGKTTIINPGISNDDKAALQMIQDLGAIVSEDEGIIQVSSKGMIGQNGAEKLTVNCGESGLGIRMFTPIAALATIPITINGKGSLLTRPMDFFDTILPQLAVSIQSQEGRLPLHIHGPLQPKDITVDGSLSSQFLTGLLFAFAVATETLVTITVTDLKSKPYIDLSLKVLSDFGYQIDNQDYERFLIYPPNNNNQNTSITYQVEGDWSGAAFLLVAGAVAGNITVKGLDVFSTQADKAILKALIDSGANISIQAEQIDISMPSVGATGLVPFHFDATDCPDLFPPLVALAANCKGKSVIEGVNRLAHKESNRGLTLQEEFGKLGINIELQDDLMIIKGGTGILEGVTYSHHDHRIAMATAIAGLNASGKVVIENADAINKSYPNFFQHIQSLGASIEIDSH